MSSDWTNWKPMPTPDLCRAIEGPEQSGVYQIRSKIKGQLVQFGIGKTCRKRMKSFFPAPYGTGKRNNAAKRKYILDNWENLEYRTIATATREEAKKIEDMIKAENNHLFNT